MREVDAGEVLPLAPGSEHWPPQQVARLEEAVQVAADVEDGPLSASDSMSITGSGLESGGEESVGDAPALRRLAAAEALAQAVRRLKMRNCLTTTSSGSVAVSRRAT